MKNYWLSYRNQNLEALSKKKLAIEEIFCLRNDFISCFELFQPEVKERWCENFDKAVFGDNEDKNSIEFIRNMKAGDTSKNILDNHKSLNKMITLFEGSSWWKDNDGWNMNGSFQSIQDAIISLDPWMNQTMSEYVRKKGI